MRVHDTLHDAEAEPVAVNVPRDRVRTTEEGFEDPRLLRRRNADASVLDADEDFAAALRGSARDADVDPRVIAAVLHGVGDEILDDGAQRRWIAVDVGNAGAERCFDRGVRFVHERCGRRKCLFDQRHWSDDGGLPHHARLDSRELQHPFDGLTQAARLGTDGGAVLLDPRRVLDDTVRQIVRRRSNHRNGGAQFVRYARDELELLPREPLCAPRRNHNQTDADAHQDENPEAQRQVAPSRLTDRGFERSRAMSNEQAPSRSIARPRRPIARGCGPASEHTDEHAAPGLPPVRVLHRAHRRGRLAEQRELVRPETEEWLIDVGASAQHARVAGL